MSALLALRRQCSGVLRNLLMTCCTISKQDFCEIFPSDGWKPAVPNLKLWFGSNRFELKQQPGQDWRCTCWMIISRASTGKCSNKFFTAVAFPPTKWEDFGFSALYFRITPAPSVSPQDRKVSRLCTHCMIVVGALRRLPLVLTRKLANNSSRFEGTATTWAAMLHIDRNNFGAALNARRKKS